jgi:DNA-binding NarL/FixJ family response regulator
MTMARDILVSIMGEDLYARDWMALLVVRDWRTRLVSEVTYDDDFMKFKAEQIHKVDFLLLDLDSYQNKPDILAEIDREMDPKKPVRVLCVGSRPEPKVFKRVNPANFAGYLLKDEISTSLAWAVTFASEGNLVLTPGTQQCGYENDYAFPGKYMVLSARQIPGLTARQAEISRLAIIFSIGRHDLADELKISDQWSYGMVSELYENLGLKEIFNGESDPYKYINEDTMIQEHLTEILAELGNSKKAKDLETLAFHLITMPAIDEYRNS